MSRCVCVCVCVRIRWYKQRTYRWMLIHGVHRQRLLETAAAASHSLNQCVYMLYAEVLVVFFLCLRDRLGLSMLCVYTYL